VPTLVYTGVHRCTNDKGGSDGNGIESTRVLESVRTAKGLAQNGFFAIERGGTGLTLFVKSVYSPVHKMVFPYTCV